MKSKRIAARGLVFDTCFHPTQEVLAVGTIEGLISIYDHDETPMELFSHLHHQDSCRSLDFTPDGIGLYSVSKDKSLLMTHIAHEKVVLQKRKAHRDPINKVKSLTDFIVATGDDSGLIKLWDLRTRKCEKKYKEHFDYITDLYFDESKNTMISTSGDGCLAAFDIRTQKPIQVSDNQDDELLAVVGNNTKAVVGTMSGTLLLFSWGDWGDCTDRFPGHPESVSCLAKANEHTLYTGSSDGLVRAVGILPNTLLGTISAPHGMPIESMSLSADKKWIATSCHDELVQLWDSNVESNDTEVFEEDLDSAKNQNNSTDECDDSDESLDEKHSKRKPKKTKRSFSKQANPFFAGLD